MHILLHSDPNSDGGHLMADHLHKVVQAAMARFAERVTRVEAHLSDVNSKAKASDDELSVRCLKLKRDIAKAKAEAEAAKKAA